MPILRGRALRRYQREAPKEIPGTVFVTVANMSSDGVVRYKAVDMPVEEVIDFCRKQMALFDRLPRQMREQVRNHPIGVMLK